MGLLYQEFSRQKKNWEDDVRARSDEEEKAKAEAEAGKIRAKELEEHLEQMAAGNNDEGNLKHSYTEYDLIKPICT